MDACVINVAYYYVKNFVFVYLKGDGGVSTKLRRNTITLNRDEIKDTPGYSEVPVQNSVSIYM